jgi:hypothetical protein
MPFLVLRAAVTATVALFFAICLSSAAGAAASSSLPTELFRLEPSTASPAQFVWLHGAFDRCVDDDDDGGSGSGSGGGSGGVSGSGGGSGGGSGDEVTAGCSVTMDDTPPLTQPRVTLRRNRRYFFHVVGNAHPFIVADAAGAPYGKQRCVCVRFVRLNDFCSQ